MNDLRGKASNPVRAKNGSDLENATNVWDTDIIKWEEASKSEIQNIISIYVSNVVSNDIANYVNENTRIGGQRQTR